MKPLKRLFFAFSILLVLLITAIVVFIATFDANQYKNQIHQLVKENTGRDLQLKGDIKLSIFPNIALDLGEATFSNLAQFDDIPFATVKSAQVGVQLMPLLHKKLLVEKIILNGLQLNLHKKANGSSNWDSVSDRSKETTSKKKFSDDFLKNFSIASIELNNATIHWRNDVSQQTLLITALNLRTGAFEPNKAIEIHLDGTLQQKKDPRVNISASLSTLLTLSQNNQFFTLKETHLKTALAGLPLSTLELLGDFDATTQQIHSSNLKLNLVGSKSLLSKGNLQLNITGDTTFNIKQQKLKTPAMQLQTRITDLQHIGSTIKATITGRTTIDLKNKQFSIVGMRLNGDAQGIINNESHMSTQVQGDAQLDLSNLLLRIKRIKLNTNAVKIFKNTGKANASITGNLRADLKDSQLDIKGMKLLVDAKELPNIADLNLDIIGNLTTKPKQQFFAIQNARIKTQLKGKILADSQLYAQLSSANLVANAKTQYLKLKGMYLNATLKGGIVPNGQLVHRSKGNIDINLSRHKGNAQLDKILIEVGKAKLTGNLKLSKLSPKPTFTGKFKTNQFNLKQLLKTLGIKLPTTSNPRVFGSSQGSFQLTATPDNVNLHALNLRIDQSRIVGDIALSNFKQIAVKTKLQISQLIFDDYLSSSVLNSPHKVPYKAPVNDKLLPVKRLKELNLNASIDVKKLHFKQLKLTNVHASIQAKNGIINATPLRFNLFKGKYNGGLNINVTKNIPVITMDHTIERLHAENLLLEFFQDRYVSGMISLKTNLTTRGNTVAILKQNLQGTADIEFQKGTIRDSKLAQKVSLAVAAFEAKKITKESSNTVTFTRLGGKWKVNKGIFSTNNIQLIAPHFLIKGNGEINIAKDQLDLKLRLGSKNKDNKLFAPLRIHGTFDQLKYELELDVLIKSLLDKRLEKRKEQLKQKLLDQKHKILEKLELRKQTELEKLQMKTEEAQQRLKSKQEKLQQRLQAEELKLQQMLQNTLKINNSSKDSAEQEADTEDKSIEEEVSDKLKVN